MNIFLKIMADTENKDEYKKLSQQEIKEEVARLQEWTVANGKLSKEFEFKDFVKAF